MLKKEKVLYMDEMYHYAMQVFQTCNYYKQDFVKMTENSKLYFRKGASELLDLCKSSRVPLIIVSGGLAELIEHSLRLLAK